jgi:hypothetical protein
LRIDEFAVPALFTKAARFLGGSPRESGED